MARSFAPEEEYFPTPVPGVQGQAQPWDFLAQGAYFAAPTPFRQPMQSAPAASASASASASRPQTHLGLRDHRDRMDHRDHRDNCDHRPAHLHHHHHGGLLAWPSKCFASACGLLGGSLWCWLLALVVVVALVVAVGVLWVTVCDLRSDLRDLEHRHYSDPYMISGHTRDAPPDARQSDTLREIAPDAELPGTRRASALDRKSVV